MQPSTASFVGDGAHRRRSLDIIRGIAVFGLIWVNLASRGLALTPVDGVASWVLTVFGSNKFVAQFSILFGITLAMQLERADSRGERIGWLWARRMAALWAIGWANLILFWPDDVLNLYAVAGAVLLVFYKTSNRMVLVAAVLTFALVLNNESLNKVAARVVRGDVATVVANERPSSEIQHRRQADNQAMQDGSYLDNVRTRAALYPALFVSRFAFLPVGPLNVIHRVFLSLFLLGLYLGRRRILQDVDEHRSFVRGMAWIGFAVGLPLSILTAAAPVWAQHPMPGTGATYASLISNLGKVILAVGYLGGLSLLLWRQTWRTRLAWLAPVGRMGLTSYIVQGIFINALLRGYGFGWDGRSGTLVNTVAAVSFFLLQVLFSNWWLARFRFGPVEWLWRSGTQWRLLPMRLDVQRVAAVAG